MRTFGLAAAVLIGGVGYRVVVGGELTLDTGLGRRIRPLGPLTFAIAAPRETVFNVIAALPGAHAPDVGRGDRSARAGQRHGSCRAPDVRGMGMVATTIETVRFERPEMVAFRLLRGPVPHVVERFTLHDDAGSTRLDYLGGLGTDYWQLGWWGDQVARKWEPLCGVPSFASVMKQNEERQQAAGTGKGDDPRSGQSGERPTPGRADTATAKERQRAASDTLGGRTLNRATLPRQLLQRPR